MKKIKAVLALSLSVFCFCGCSFIETHYSKMSKVVEVRKDVVTVVDENGYLWAFETSGFEVNDDVKLIMDTNHTDSNIFDDIIVKAIKKER